jgi:uncharacterized protein
MEFKEEGFFIVVRLKEDENYISSLRKVAQECDIKAGFVLNSVGMLKDIELGFFQGKGKYKANKFTGPMEVTSVQGNFAMMDQELKHHLHINLADKDGRVFGGHLEKGTVAVTAEIVILKLEKIKMLRSIEEMTGLAGLRLE